jgi:tRNA (guanine-N7-)-methyltransferase
VLFAAQPEIDWSELFGNDRPVEIEIGCGKGAFLLAYASLHQDTNLLGIERQFRWVRRIEARLVRAPRANARALSADAAFVISRLVRDESVRAYHLYFPDPWWKRRHEKRRVVQEELVSHLFRTLEPGGALYLATDVRDRFEAMIAELSRSPFEIAITTSPAPEGRPLTNFERKYQQEKRRLYYATLRKPR